MPPGVAVSPSSIAPGYAACTLINAQQDRQQQALLRGTFPGSVADMHVGTGSSASSSSSSSSSSRSSSSSSGESAELSDKDQLQVESCYKGLKTQVYVCGSMANLYSHNSSATSSAAAAAADGSNCWELKFTGIPVVLYDSGETRCRDKPRIQILLVERGTCFALWRDTIDNLTSYKVSSQGFHTMCLSTDHTRLIGLSFDCAEAAHRLWAHIDRLTSDPENIRLSGPGSRSKHSRGRKHRPAPVRPLPDKSHISQPCCFEHVTNVEVSDRSRYQSLQNLVAAAPRLRPLDTAGAATAQ